MWPSNIWTPWGLLFDALSSAKIAFDVEISKNDNALQNTISSSANSIIRLPVKSQTVGLGLSGDVGGKFSKIESR
jgi:hypothetical protein